jgi:hypothetical protein
MVYLTTTTTLERCPVYAERVVGTATTQETLFLYLPASRRGDATLGHADIERVLLVLAPTLVAVVLAGVLLLLPRKLKN